MRRRTGGSVGRLSVHGIAGTVGTSRLHGRRGGGGRLRLGGDSGRHRSRRLRGRGVICGDSATTDQQRTQPDTKKLVVDIHRHLPTADHPPVDGAI